ncbi:uncharacterized protein PHALS_15173 [Plasmopara halstedii]|uniref:Uncharacterized protein n=1 Tax=Plasmopara halstedii TaxID=4781 RepID=A0A0P1B3E5_PLAHL|nr:uncharacterized protein PHALS_15173 [Plasmopara halstedii]CEG48786.1 hypothetical protein PHALS_15173 [Plasmopara halstedii]|eukprot:XP_024585155.1 hypothetical protein PHALS_15173 [Plasmopara halstedii]
MICQRHHYDHFMVKTLQPNAMNSFVLQTFVNFFREEHLHCKHHALRHLESLRHCDVRRMHFHVHWCQRR